MAVCPEPLRGYLLLAERLSEDGAEFASGWNFGPADTDAMPVSWIADTMAGHWGENASWMRNSSLFAKEAHALKLDVSKAAANLRWHPAIPLEKTLSWIVDWYKAFEAEADLRAVTLQQIRDYETLLPGMN